MKYSKDISTKRSYSREQIIVREIGFSITQRFDTERANAERCEAFLAHKISDFVVSKGTIALRIDVFSL